VVSFGRPTSNHQEDKKPTIAIDADLKKRTIDGTYEVNWTYQLSPGNDDAFLVGEADNPLKDAENADSLTIDRVNGRATFVRRFLICGNEKDRSKCDRYKVVTTYDCAPATPKF
jgi:hypothetical protein